RTRRSGSRAASLLRLAAVTIGRSDTALGAFYRRLSPVPENRKPSPRQPARLPRCSTMRCVTVWITSIRGHHITRPAIGSGLSKIYIGVPRPSDSFCKQQRCRPPSRPFLRKLASLLGPPAESDGGS